MDTAITSTVRSAEHVSIDSTLGDLLSHPVFSGFASRLLPWDDRQYDLSQPLREAGSLMPYHSAVNPGDIVHALNAMIDQAKRGDAIFHDFYSNTEKQADPTKTNTGLFFFRGKPGAPLAVISPGGGFSYVGSLHEGFPPAAELSKKGYNAFVLKYRVGSESRATEDLVAALSYIFNQAEMFEVGVENYSLWGFSAGARMVGNIASGGTFGFGGDDLPKPRIIVIAYTGHTIFSKNLPPTFIVVSEDDGIVYVPTVDRRVENMRNAGIEVAYRKYRNAGHGFGLGTGTDAEGWIKYAIQFWENH